MRQTLRVALSTTLALIAALGQNGALQAQGPPAPQVWPDAYAQMRWRYVGPEGNRTDAIAGVPGDPLVYYSGSASGGVFKTVDGGIHWTPVFDDQPVSSIGALAVAPSVPNTVWAGTGEAFIRSHVSVGEGIFKSTDAGQTWTRMGLERTGRIARIVIDPDNPDIVMACALGHAYGPQPERGVFRTTDGGRNWDRVLFVDENTGCSDIAMNPRNPRVLFAGMWQLEIHTWGRDSGGPGSGLFTSRDGGATWTRLTGRGLPLGPVGKVAVAISKSNPSRIYALIETGDGVPLNGKETERGQIWRSEDGGTNWRMINTDRNAMGRAHYYSRMAVAPDNENETYYLTALFSTSIDGGVTLTAAPHSESPGGDNHDMWIDPTNADRMAVANDAGVSISVTRGRSWQHVRLPNAQLYHVTVDNQIPYNLYGNKQDGPSYRGPSNSRLGGFGSGEGGGGDIPRSMWHAVAGGESGWATPDPVDPNLVWSSASGSGSVGGIVIRYEESRRQGRNVEVWPEQLNGPAADLKYRFAWTMPLALSPHDRNKIYVGSQHVHQTTDGGQSWQVISPDLSLNDKSHQRSSGGLTPDNIGAEYAGVVFAIAESPKQAGLIWAGTNDGLVQLTRDGGKTWTNVTKNLHGLPPLGTVSNIEASRYDAGTAYLTVDLHQVNNRDPFVYKTADYGQTWKAITNGIPRSMLSYAHCVREDPVRRGMLYLGTENALYVSFDDGETWQPLQMNLPHAPVYWITVQEHFGDLVIATYGRGFWILDDITALRQLTPQTLAAEVQLFPLIRPTYRFRDITGEASFADDPTVGRNPPYGAAINYYLKSAPAGSVAISILDRDNQVVRTLSGTRRAGLNRVYWDLRSTSATGVRYRTSPLYAPDIEVGPDGFREGGRGHMAILQPPGAYTVTLTVGGRDYAQPLMVRKDPNASGTEAEIELQTKMLLELQKSLEAASAVVNEIELVRSQLAGLGRIANEDEVRRAGSELEKALIDLEQHLVELRATGRGQDNARWSSKLVDKIQHLANGLASGDHKPTDQQREVQKVLDERLKNYQSALEGLRARITSGFNERLRRKNLPVVLVQPPT